MPIEPITQFRLDNPKMFGAQQPQQKMAKAAGDQSSAVFAGGVTLRAGMEMKEFFKNDGSALVWSGIDTNNDGKIEQKEIDAYKAAQNANIQQMDKLQLQGSIFQPPNKPAENE